MRMALRSIAQRGATLVELVVSIVVISVALAGVLIVMNRTTQSSGDALVEHQAIAIAEAYLEEVLAKPFCDPDGSPCLVGNVPGSANCLVCPASEASRDLYDNVCDYNNLPDSVVRDQLGNAVSGLGSYAAAVNVSTGDTLGPAGGQLAGGNCEVLAVRVTVTGPGATSVVLTGYRANY